jgi:hypothetical protein
MGYTDVSRDILIYREKIVYRASVNEILSKFTQAADEWHDHWNYDESCWRKRASTSL